MKCSTVSDEPLYFWMRRFNWRRMVLHGTPGDSTRLGKCAESKSCYCNSPWKGLNGYFTVLVRRGF